MDDFLREIPRAARDGLGVALLVVGLAPLVLTMLVLRVTHGMSWPLLFPALVVGGLILLRAWVTANTMRVTIDPLPAKLAIGQRFAWGVTVRARRDVSLGPATLTVRCQEHAIVRSGNNTSHYRRVIYEHRYAMSGCHLRPGEEVEIRPEAVIPVSALPAYGEHNHRIEWTAELTAPPSGFCSRIKEKVALRVASVVPDQGHPGDQHVPVTWLAQAPVFDGRPGRIELLGAPGASAQPLRGITAMADGMIATLEPSGGIATSAGPIIPAGTTREMKLLVEAREKLGCRGLLVQATCEITGRGRREEVVVLPEFPAYQGELAPGQSVAIPLRIGVPTLGPVTYAGQYVTFTWLVRVRADMPFRHDPLLSIPFVVTPQATQPAPEGPALGQHR